MNLTSLTTSTQSIAARARAWAAREPKKALACAALLVVLGATSARSFFAATPATSHARTTRADSERDVASRDGFARDADARAARADKLESWLSQSFEGPSRNLFEFRPENYASASRDGAGETDAVPNAAEAGQFWNRLAKSLRSRADLRRQQEIRTDNVAAAAARLRLQSTVIRGGTPQAMIDGQLVKAGDVVTSGTASPTEHGPLAFRVVRIDRQTAVVERDGVQVELSMACTGKVRVLSDDE